MDQRASLIFWLALAFLSCVTNHAYATSCSHDDEAWSIEEQFKTQPAIFSGIIKKITSANYDVAAKEIFKAPPEKQFQMPVLSIYPSIDSRLPHADEIGSEVIFYTRVGSDGKLYINYCSISKKSPKQMMNDLRHINSPPGVIASRVNNDFANFDLIFSGVVKSRVRDYPKEESKGKHTRRDDIEFEVSEVFKNRGAAEIRAENTFRVKARTCGARFIVGHRYLVMAQQGRKFLTVPDGKKLEERIFTPFCEGPYPFDLDEEKILRQLRDTLKGK